MSVGPGFWRNLGIRLLTALVALPLLLLALFWAPPAAIVGIVAVALLLGLREFFWLLEARELVPMRLAGGLLGAAIFAEMVLPGWSGVPVWPALALVLFASTLPLARDPSKAISSIAVTLLGAVYLGALGGALAGLRLLEPTQLGAWRITLLLAASMGADVFAFFVGHGLGRHRLAPAISPGKTKEGALGGLVGGAVGALVVARLGLPGLSLPTAGLLGLLVALAGVLGDLFESELKRWAGIKDSGRLLPGHGGVLDRLDALLFGAPVLYYYFSYVH